MKLLLLLSLLSFAAMAFEQTTVDYGHVAITAIAAPARPTIGAP